MPFPTQTNITNTRGIPGPPGPPTPLPANGNPNNVLTDNGTTWVSQALPASPQPGFNSQRVARGRWWTSNQTGILVATDHNPTAMCWNGTDFLICNQNPASNGCTVVTPASWSVAASFPAATSPSGCCHDGKYWWIAGNSTTIGQYAQGGGSAVNTVALSGASYTQDCKFDGTNVWITDSGTTNLYKVVVSSLAQSHVTVGAGARGLTIGNGYAWTANYTDGTVSQVSISTGLVVNTITVGTHPWGIYYNGTYVLVSLNGSSSIVVMNATTGAIVTTITVGSGPNNTNCGMQSDGVSTWITNYTDNTVSIVNNSTLIVTATVTACSHSGGHPTAIGSDGCDMWVCDWTNYYVGKL